MSDLPAHNAVLLVAFGGPEGPDDVVPFLENVTRGRGIPRERLEEVGEHYKLFGGVSPVNAHSRELRAAIEAELRARDSDLPVYWGNRNWHPMLEDTMQTMVDDGIRRAVAIVASAYSCYSGCRQYREDIERAQKHVGEDNAPTFSKMRVFYNHPGFIEPMRDRVRDALANWPEADRANVRLVFTAHSIPSTMAYNSRYESQLHEATRLVAESFPANASELVYQSRSGPPHVPWLEPDVCDRIEQLHEAGVSDIVIVPIGFLSDHIEVLYDLDTEAKEVCDKLGVKMVRAGTVGSDPAFVRALVDMIEERIANDTEPGSHERVALGCHGASHDVCPPGCCAAPARPTRPAGSSRPHPHAP